MFWMCVINLDRFEQSCSKEFTEIEVNTGNIQKQFLKYW